MTVKELIAKLILLPQELPLVISIDEYTWLSDETGWGKDCMNKSIDQVLDMETKVIITIQDQEYPR